MPDHSLQKSIQKNTQRQAGISARKGLDRDAAARFSRIISEKLISSAYGKAAVIFSYQPFGGEVDISYFNEWAVSEKKRVAFPICRDGGKMTAALPNGPDAWEIGKYGIRTPVESRSTLLEPAELELVIVPCAAFHGTSKMRIGMGAGYYDRYLPQCGKAAAIAVAFEAQRLDDLRADEWDMPLTHIVTEERWY